MKFRRAIALSGVLALGLWHFATVAYGQATATNITGLYYTGVDANNNLVAQGTQSPSSAWKVTSAYVNGTAYNGSSTTYTGKSYVISSSLINPGDTQNTGSAQWVVAPGASTAQTGGTVNAGGDFLPGDVKTGSGAYNNSAYFVYQLAFTITGTGSGTISGNTSNIQISMTLAADDTYSVYVNPAGAMTFNGSGTLATGGTTAAATLSANAWQNTTAINLGNSTNNGGVNNASFVIGTNYIDVVVANTNSGVSGSNTNSLLLNPSGLLVYQTSAATINGHPVPEVTAWLPVAVAIGLFGLRRFRRDSPLPA